MATTDRLVFATLLPLKAANKVDEVTMSYDMRGPRKSVHAACQGGTAAALTLVILMLSGCSGNGGSTLTGNTSVTVLATNTANDEFVQNGLVLDQLSLINDSGNRIDMLDSPLRLEFTHLNGTAEPILTANIPKDTYTLASASFGPSSYVCLSLLSPGNIYYQWFGQGSIPVTETTVQLPAPITVKGSRMVLDLNLLVSESSGMGCSDTSPIMPFFTLQPLTVAKLPDNDGNGMLSALEGVIASANSTAIDVHSTEGALTLAGAPTNPFGPDWEINIDSNTSFQGVTGPAQLIAGLPVEVDAAVQTDGSLLASRVQVYDTNTTNLSVWNGPMVKVGNSTSAATILPRTESGPDVSSAEVPVIYSGAVFTISSELSNLDQLPFTPSFTAATMVAGQNVAVTMHDASFPFYPNYPTAATLALTPQTINGTVVGISTEGNFNVYTVSLASYDLFPTFAVQTDQTTRLIDAGTVTVYADDTTANRTTQTISDGSVVRFYGLVFNDNGTLRMDSSQISDGVAP